jgi:hypothetical protein
VPALVLASHTLKTRSLATAVASQVVGGIVKGIVRAEVITVVSLTFPDPSEPPRGASHPAAAKSNACVVKMSARRDRVMVVSSPRDGLALAGRSFP